VRTDLERLKLAAKNHPGEWSFRLAIAEYLADRGNVAEADGWKWVAAFRRSPGPIETWYSPDGAGVDLVPHGWTEIKPPWQTYWPAAYRRYAIPAALFRFLPVFPHAEGFRFYVSAGAVGVVYTDAWEAELALVQAFVSATKPRRWFGLTRPPAFVPDWVLAVHVNPEPGDADYPGDPRQWVDSRHLFFLKWSTP
jgi:hypothetical protein